MTTAQRQDRPPVSALDGDAGGATPEQVEAIAETVSRLTRGVERTRQRFIAAARHDVEWSAHLLISKVAASGPVRASALAELLHTDPSTVSRQVAALVKDGLLERQADPGDGRASLLVVSEKGRAVYRDQLARRDAHFARMVEGWPERDVRRFAALLARFTDQYETVQSRFWADMDPTARSTDPRKES